MAVRIERGVTPMPGRNEKEQHMKHKTLRTLLCVILTVCFCLSAIAPVSAAGLFSGDTGAASIFDEWIRSLKDRFIEKNPGTDETPAEPMDGTGTDGFEYKIVFLDCGRKYFSVDSIKTIIDNAAAAGFNYVQLAVGNDGMRFLLDDMSLTVNGVTYSHNDVSAAIHEGNEAYYNFTTDELTQSEMDTIIAYAKEKGIGIIPCVNTPGHMDAILHAASSLTGENCSYSGSARTIDVTIKTAVAFTQAFVQKYIDYFAGKGCKLFNMGADEYANDIYTGGSMGFGNLQSTGKYSCYVTYVNQLAKMIKDAGMTPMAFNDGIYFNSDTSSGTFDTDIIICYWSNGWNSYTPMPATTLASKGFRMVNTNGSYYWVLGKADAQCNADKASGFNYKAFPGGTIDKPAGAMFCIWCDYPGAETEESTLTKTAATIAAFGGALPKDTPTISGIKDGDSLTIGSSVTLSVSGGADATWTSSDTEVLNLEAVTGDAVAAAVGTVTAKSVKATALKKGSATVTAATADGKTASATIQVYSETDPVTKNIELVIGEEKTDIQAGDVTGQVGDYDNSIVTITTAHQTIDGTTETSVAKIAMSKYGQYKGVISDGTNYMVVDSNGKITNTDKAKNATEFVVTYSKDGYTISTKDSTYNLNVSVSGRNYNPTFTLVAAESSATNWSYSDGFNYKHGNYYYNRYLCCYNGSWTVISEQNSNYYTASHLYKVTTTTTEPVNQTTITFKGKAVGTTSVTIGGVQYNINVTEENLNTVTPLTVEYWITNSRFKDSSNNYLEKVINATDNGIATEQGVEIVSLIPDTNSKDGRTQVYWQSKILDVTKTNTSTSGTELQTLMPGDDETLNGFTFTKVRYWNGEWQVFTTEWISVDRTSTTVTYNNGNETYTGDRNQLVAYYMELINIDNANGKSELVVKAADWGTKGDGTGNWGYTPESDRCSVSVQIVYEDATTNPADITATALKSKTIVYGYWSGGRGLGTMIFTGNGYDIYKVTATTGTMRSTASASNTVTVTNLTWHENEKTVWGADGSLENSVSIVNPARNPSYKSPLDNLAWNTSSYNENNAILIRVYVRTKVTEDTLKVNYFDEKSPELPFYDYNIAVEEGRLFDANFGMEGSGLVNNTVTNINGVEQTVLSDLTKMTEIGAQYRYSKFNLTRCELSADRKTVNLYYTFDNTASFVIDFGLPLTIPYTAINPELENPTINAVSFTSPKYGTVTEGADHAIIYTPTKTVDKIDNFQVTYTGTRVAKDGETQGVVTYQVYIIPATNVLYEENFMSEVVNTGTTNTSPWTKEGSTATPNQTLEEFGKKTYAYGYDPAYGVDKTNNLSMGSAYKTSLTVTADQFSAATSSDLVFTFEGTGYDIISACGTNTGMLIARTYQMSADGKTKTLKALDIIDTYFCGDANNIITGDGVLDYQVPVFRKVDLDYATYRVEVRGYLRQGSGVLTASTNGDVSLASLELPVTVDYASSANSVYDDILADIGAVDLDGVEVNFTFMDNNSILNGGTGIFTDRIENELVSKESMILAPAAELNANTNYTAGSADVYVDAFRVYNPLDVDTDEYENKFTKNSYGNDGEGYLKYGSVYEYVLAAGTDVYDDLWMDNSAVYVEYDGNKGIAEIVDYHRQGPNNEVYLSSDGSNYNYVGFIIDGWVRGTSKVMVSASVVSGNPSLKAKTSANASVAIAEYNSVADEVQKLSRTEMYYDVTDKVMTISDASSSLNGKSVLVIGNESNDTSVLAISNIKISSNCTAISGIEGSKLIENVVASQGESSFTPKEFSESHRSKVKSGNSAAITIKASDEVTSFNLYSVEKGKETLVAGFNPNWTNKRAYDAGRTKTKSYSAFIDVGTVTVETTKIYHLKAVNADGVESNPIEIKIVVVQ